MKSLKINGFDALESKKEKTWEGAMALAENANSKALGGFTDWLLPDVQTLFALILLDNGDNWYWSSSPFDNNPEEAWSVDFEGEIISYSKSYDGGVCLVRAGQCLDIGRAGQIESLRLAGIKLKPSKKRAREFKGCKNSNPVKLLNICGFDALYSDERMTLSDAMLLAVIANAEALHGFKDWILPDTYTLMALGFIEPTVRSTWESPSFNLGSAYDWGDDLEYRFLDHKDQKEKFRALLLRGGQFLDLGRAGQIASMRRAGIAQPDASEPIQTNVKKGCEVDASHKRFTK